MSKLDVQNLKFPLLIDGGLSNVLEKMGCNLNHSLWTAKLLLDHEETIIKAHMKYLAAGAQCLTTSSYQASIPGLMKLGYNLEESKNNLLKSVKCAVTALKMSREMKVIDNIPLIAASIGPYGATLADGSEYHGDYGIDDQDLRNFHKDRINLLAESEADLLALETIPSIQEAQILSSIMKNIHKPAWISFSCKDDKHLNDGTPIEDVASIFINHPTIFAVGVNCTHPKFISGLIKRIKSCAGQKKIIVYPNSGEVYHVPTKSWLGLSEPLHFTTLVKEWIELGADMIGGCCRIGPQHISDIRQFLNTNSAFNRD